jgi:hypothetical protein
MRRSVTCLSLAAMGFGLFASAFSASPGMARQWSASPQGAAVDYTQIIDSKPNGDFIFLWWPVPEAFPSDPNTQVVRNVLSRYVFLGIAHGRNGGAGLTYFAVNDVKAADGASRDLSPLTGTAMTPEIAQTLAALQAIQHPMRQGIRWFVFDGATVHSCAAGKLSVPFEGTTYTFDTPVPGCAK